MIRTTTLLFVAALAGTAHANFVTIGAQFSLDGVSWSDAAFATPGQTVHGRLLMYWGTGVGSVAVAMASCNINQLDVSGSFAGDIASNFSGKFQPATQTFQLYNAGTGSAKIDRLDSPAGTIQMGQLAPNLGGSTDNPIVYMNYDYTVSALATTGQIVISAPQSAITVAALYSTAAGSVTSISAANRTLLPGTIFVPAPSAASLLGVGALAVRRRSRV